MAEEMYGHRRYSCSDFGFWSCAWCGAEGSDHPDEPPPSDVPCEGGGLAASVPVEAVRLLHYDGTVADRGAVSRALAAVQGAAAEAEADGDHGAAQLDLLGRLQHLLAGLGDPAVHDPVDTTRSEVLEVADGRVATVVGVPVHVCKTCRVTMRKTGEPSVSAVLSWAQTEWLPTLPGASHTLVRWSRLLQHHRDRAV